MYSGGFPRRINIICDHSLLSGYVKEQKIITAVTVKECAKELKIPAYVRNRDINGFADYHDRYTPAVTPQPPQSPVHQAEPDRRETSKIGDRNTIGKTRIEHQKKKSKLQFFITGIVCLFFVCSVWFFMFPDSFKNSLAVINQHMAEIKYKVSQVVSGPVTSSLKQKQVKEDMTDNMEKEKIVTKKVVGLKEANPVIGEIKIFEDEDLNQDEFSHIIQPQEGPESKANTVGEKMETELDPADVTQDIKKRVLPLPDEKTIVRFTYNTNDFSEEGFQNLNDLADVLITHPEVKILISGHTDSAGNQNYNLKLSEFRANIVRSFFLGRGIKNEQIQIMGLGSQNPIESNDTSWGRMMNRRVEIEVIKG